MNYRYLLLFLLIVLSCNHVIAEGEIRGDSIVVITYAYPGNFHFLRDSSYQKIKTYLKSKFEKVNYISTSNKKEADSLYHIYNKAIFFEARWTKVMGDRCCFGRCDDQKLWVLRTWLKIKSKVESDFIIKSYDERKLYVQIKKALNRKKKKPIRLHEKLFVLYDKKVAIQEEYTKSLKEEFGADNVTEIRFGNGKILSTVDYDCVEAMFSYSYSGKEFIVELQDVATGRILRRTVLNR